MPVSDRDVAAVQRYYPQIYLACHTQHQRRRTTSANLTANESSLLAHLAHDEPLRAATLARHLGVGASTLSAAVKRLTALGYIVRERDRNDHRALALRLSAQGARAMQGSSVLETRRVAHLLAQLSAADRARAIDGLRLLADASEEDGQMLKTLTWIIGVLFALGIVIAVIGWLLPVRHVASRTATVAAPPERVFDVISRVDEYQTWWSEISRVEMLPSVGGRTRFRQDTSTGGIVMEVTESASPTRFVTRIDDPEQPFGGTWTWELAPEGRGTKVTITERGELQPDLPLHGALRLRVTGTMESALAALTAHTK